MPSLKITGTRSLLAKLRKDEELLQGKIAQTHRNIVGAMFEDLVSKSPQWSGALASSWYVTYTGVPAGPKKYRNRKWGKYSWGNTTHGGPYKMGDNPAVRDTLGRELPKIRGIRWNTKVTLTNTATYAQEVLVQGLGPTYGGKYHPLRPENLYSGRIALVNYVSMKYNRKAVLRKFKA